MKCRVVDFVSKKQQAIGEVRANDWYVGKDDLCLCPECRKRASAKETLKRLKPINDPVITEALKD
jgi:hypothetical protein